MKCYMLRNQRLINQFAQPDMLYDYCLRKPGCAASIDVQKIVSVVDRIGYYSLQKK